MSDWPLSVTTPIAFSSHGTDNVYLNAARSLDIPFREVIGARRFWLIGTSNRFVHLQHGALGVNSSVVARFTRDKAASQFWLRENKLPVPEFLFKRLTDFSAVEVRDIQEFAEDRFPVVVKPNGSSQARGVFTDIRTQDELTRVLAHQRRARIHDLMIEKHFAGEIYRVIVFDEEVIDVCHWMLSIVQGDGISTVRELIASLNERETFYPPVAFDIRLVELLEKQNLRPNDVPVKGAPVKITGTGGRKGCRRYRIALHTVPSDNLECFLNARRVIGARLLGIDVICNDITRPWREQSFCINEVNSSPGFGLSYPDVDENDLAPANRILEKVFA